MQRRLLWLIILILVLVAPLWSTRVSAEYRTIEVEGLKITIDSDWGLRTAPGYLPVRFDITNLADAREIEIVGNGTRFIRAMRGTQPGGVRVHQQLRMARGDRVRLTFPVPIFADNENFWFAVQEGGRNLETFHYTGFQSRLAATDAAAIIVADPSSSFGTMATTWTRTVSTASSPSGYSAIRPGSALDVVLSPARMPSNWLGYTSIRAVVIGPSEWQQLDVAQKSAVVTWIACGGVLLLVDGDVNAILPGTIAATPDASAPSSHQYFFGRIHQVAAGSIAAHGLAAALTDAEKIEDAEFLLPANRTPDWGKIVSRGFRLPIPGVGGIPARAYLLILVVFSLLIGPANYWFLWRRRQHVLFVLTAPLISAAFILLLAGYVVAGEGLGVRGRAMTLTLLDQARKQAATRASMSLYAAGMTPAGGLRFARDVAVYPIGPDGNGVRDSQVMDLTEAQRFSAGVIQARAPANLEQLTFRPARERLSFTREGNSVTVVNGLDVMVKTLVYRDGSARYVLERPLPPGGKDVLKVGSPNARLDVPADLPEFPDVEDAFTYRSSSAYVAVLDRSPFWDAGVSNVEERGSLHVLLGWPEGQR